jgi:hypothetical protein
MWKCKESGWGDEIAKRLRKCHGNTMERKSKEGMRGEGGILEGKR